MNIKKFENVYQFKITLKNTKPPIWRRIQVPENFSFWDLHVAIQDSMGWYDYHLHEFETINNNYKQVKRIGVPDFDSMESNTLIDWKENIKDWFSLNENKAMNYIYDFGDSWNHRIELEKILKKKDNVNYPVCIKGKRACPPEDCGGVWGYENTLEVIKDPKHSEYNETIEWLEGDFDPEKFDCNDVVFDDPKERLKDKGLLEEIENTKIIESEENRRKPEMKWEIDYSEFPKRLINEKGEAIKAFVMLIVHPDSYYIISTQIANSNDNYLQEFSDKILIAIKNKSFTPERIFVKKKDLFDMLQKNLKGTDIKIELVKRTKVVEFVKRDMNKYFK